MGARALIAGVIATVLGAWLCACSGPRATATETRVHPAARAGFYPSVSGGAPAGKQRGRIALAP